MTRAVAPIEKHPEICGGEACLAGTRIPVWLLEQARRLGTPKTQLPALLPDAHGGNLSEAWAYASANRQEIDQAIRENEAD